MQRRLLILLGALAIGGLFAAGLFTHGYVSGFLLVVTDSILAVLTRTAWDHLRPQGRPVRVVIIAAIAALAVARMVSA